MNSTENLSLASFGLAGLSGTPNPDGSLTRIGFDFFPHGRIPKDSRSLEGRVTLPLAPVKCERSLEGILLNIKSIEEVYVPDLRKLEDLEGFPESDEAQFNAITLYKQILKCFTGASWKKNFSELDLDFQEQFLVSTIRSHFHGLFLFIYTHPLYSSKLTFSIHSVLLRESIKCSNDCSVKAIFEKSVEFSPDLIESFFRTAYRFGNGVALVQILKTHGHAISDQCFSEAVEFLIKTSKWSALNELQDHPRFSCLDDSLQKSILMKVSDHSRSHVEVPYLGGVVYAHKQSLFFPKVRKPVKEITNLMRYEKKLYAHAINLRKALGVEFRDSRSREIASWDKEVVCGLVKFLRWPDYKGGQDISCSSFVLNTLAHVISSESKLLVEILISIATENYLTTDDLAEFCFLIIKMEKFELLSFIFLSFRFSLLDQETIETLFALLVVNNEVDAIRELMLTEAFLSVSKEPVFLACKETLKRVFPSLFKDYLLTPQFALFSDEQLDEICRACPSLDASLIEFIQSFKKTPALY
jgi:hypothetical protein